MWPPGGTQDDFWVPMGFLKIIKLAGSSITWPLYGSYAFDQSAQNCFATQVLAKTYKSIIFYVLDYLEEWHVSVAISLLTICL